MPIQDHLPEELLHLYEVYERGHAAAILAGDFRDEFSDLCTALLRFRFTEDQVKSPGGNESEIPKTFSQLLRPRWIEKKINATFLVDDEPVSVDTHKIDYLRDRVAVDVEWNSKDQTFDRDLFAFRAFHEFGKISVGVLITRSDELDPWFQSLGSYKDKNGAMRRYADKYGASTTHMGKLLTRLNVESILIILLWIIFN